MKKHLVQTVGNLPNRLVHVIDAKPSAAPCTGEPGVRGQNVPIRPSQLEWDILHQLMHLAMGAGFEAGSHRAHSRIGGGALLQGIRHIMVAEQRNHLTFTGFTSAPGGERVEESDQSIVGHVPIVADIAQQDHTVSVLALRHPTNQRQQICFRMQVADEQCAHQIVAPRVGRMPMSGVVNAIRPLLTMRLTSSPS